ncbi:DUF5522 domain-containing protein [Cyclobacteriaceae bacterium]|nr:hypothetical protein [Flammeovirgaceae bacterium]MDA7854356.1 DUF5522 domain-containing protein [Cyclobacteriaceae bacterium]MDB4291273.1 DUF5522 domain-containing protein [Cyclobacteriaceae bacterium]MDB4315037.1 DUF5522 domain-containing protein [Cyclobacteriaceae bacterium]MDB4605891.1 DUF5522 domain-containing protein [Cyclobacteriaceae bacterium]
MTSNKGKKEGTPPVEEADYYFNKEGLMVFTASYHLKRGFCCACRCINCPYPIK